MFGAHWQRRLLESVASFLQTGGKRRRISSPRRMAHLLSRGNDVAFLCVRTGETRSQIGIFTVALPRAEEACGVRTLPTLPRESGSFRSDRRRSTRGAPRRVQYPNASSGRTAVRLFIVPFCVKFQRLLPLCIFATSQYSPPTTGKTIEPPADPSSSFVLISYRATKRTLGSGPNGGTSDRAVLDVRRAAQIATRSCSERCVR